MNNYVDFLEDEASLASMDGLGETAEKFEECARRITSLETALSHLLLVYDLEDLPEGDGEKFIEEARETLIKEL